MLAVSNTDVVRHKPQLYVHRIENPAAFGVPAIVRLFGQAFAAGYPAPAPQVIMEMRRLIGMESLAVFYGSVDAEPRALAIVMVPSSPLFPLPQVYHFFNKGPARLRNLLLDAMVDWTREKGYTGLMVANWTGQSDEKFERGFRRIGSFERIGSAYKIEVAK